jgi:hypothetical protein
MKPFPCPSCGATVSVREAADGWCDACGKQLPPSPLAGSASQLPPDGGPSALGKWLTWVGVAGLLLCLGSLVALYWLPLGPLEARQDSLGGEMKVVLLFLAVAFGSLIAYARRFRR